jgi:DNA-binding SARP family transcriptional activator
MRQAIDEDIIVARGNEALSLSDSVWCDAQAFETSLSAGRLHEALELYQGELLPGFFVPDSGAFEEWLESERARYRTSAAAAAWSLVERYDNDEEFTNATQMARVVARLAPSDERMLRKVISLLSRHGDRAGAVEIYQSFAQRLWRDYETRPSVETTRLIESIQGDPG